MATTNKIPTAICGASGANEQILYRGIRENSRTDRYQFWATSRQYAAAYAGHDGQIMSGALRGDAAILNLISDDACDEDGWYAAEKLERMLPGLPSALGMAADDVISRDRLWDVAGDDLSGLADLLAANGFDGMRWLEGDGGDEALLLIIR